jgi:nucleoside-diphosphate-sugar epimerase
VESSKVLITGATGFIGANCIAPLRRIGYRVVATYRNTRPEEHDGVEWINADLLEVGTPQALVRDTRPDCLLHLAWYVEPGAAIESPINLQWMESSLALLREFRDAGGKRCVFAGTCYEYDWRYGYCSESLTPVVPNTLYGSVKAGLACTVLAYARAVGLSAAWGRLFFLYGRHENPRRLVPAVILALLRGESAKTSHGLQIRDYMSATDAAEAFVALLSSNVQGAFNIATGQGVPIRHIVERIGDIIGRRDLLQVGAIPARANDVPLVVGSADKSTAEFGWKSRIPLDDGLEDTIDWWRERIKLGAVK